MSSATAERDEKLEPYRPSNGTEGDIFMSAWCGKCKKDKPWSEGKDYDACGPEDLCDIIARSMAFNIGEKGYPVEWVYRMVKADDGIDIPEPQCTAFVSVDEPEPRCKHTVDMFTGAPDVAA